MDSIDLYVEYMCAGLWNILFPVDLSYFSPLYLLEPLESKCNLYMLVSVGTVHIT